MTTTDFNEWLDGIDLSDFNDVESLYRSVTEKEDWGGFSTEETNSGQLIVSSSDTDDKLRLASQKAVDAFIKHLQHNYCDDMDVDPGMDLCMQ